MSFVLLLIGFVLLIKGADVFVEGSSLIAKRFGIPSMIIGLTIVAMGTSAPEASVSIISSLAGQNDMSIANVVGSNLFNILVVLGVSSIIAKLPVKEETMKEDIPFLIIASVLLLASGIGLTVGRIESMAFLLIFIGFLMNIIRVAKRNTVKEENNEKSAPLWKAIIMSIVGLIGIIIGGDTVVDSATVIATMFGMSANLIGLTIVAVGTSLPEFVTSVMALKKGETDIAIGNVIGSNIFNILFVLGLAGLINPITMSIHAFIDIIFMIIVTALMYFFIRKENALTKKHGIIFIAIYMAYMLYKII